MNNVFQQINPELNIEKYDLKGSTFERYLSDRKIGKGEPYKDCDFISQMKKINLSQ